LSGRNVTGLRLYFNSILSTILESFSGSCKKLASLGIHHCIILL
jgi:hypothetical protein